MPDAHEFQFTLPDDIVTSRPPPSQGPRYGIAYVFFAACAGQLAPATTDNPGGGEVGDFPLTCLDAEGNTLGPDSFIIGYTQVYAFEDERQNQNPPLIDVVPQDVEIPAESSGDLVEVQACPVDNETRRTAGCGEDPTVDCERYVFFPRFEQGQLVAEVEPEDVGPDGERLEEVVWVSYFVDGARCRRRSPSSTTRSKDASPTSAPSGCRRASPGFTPSGRWCAISAAVRRWCGASCA